jgi:hypothetical protein
MVSQQSFSAGDQGFQALQLNHEASLSASLSMVSIPCSKPETFVASIYQSVAWSFLAVVLEQIHQRPMQPCSRFDSSIYAAGCRSARNQGVAVQMELSGFDWAWNEMAMVNCAEQTMQGRCLVVWVDWLIEKALVKWLIRGQQHTHIEQIGIARIFIF